MDFLDVLPSSAPKKWLKQEKTRIQEEINKNVNLLKQHAALRKKVGLSQAVYNYKQARQAAPIIERKDTTSEIWGVKLAYSIDIPKKRGRPRKSDIDSSQTRIVLFKSGSNSKS